MEHVPPTPLFHKPLSIVAAKNILYADLFLSIITWAVARWATAIFATTPVQSVIMLIVILGITYGLIKCIGLGMRWARLLLLVLFLLELAFLVWAHAALFNANMLITVLCLLQLSLQVIALYYLFSRNSTQWFNRVKEKANDEPTAPLPHAKHTTE
jgi:hypothetical protein